MFNRQTTWHLIAVAIVSVFALLFVPDVHAQQQYGIGVQHNRPPPAVNDCRALPVVESSEKSLPFIQIGNAGRFQAHSASCIRFDFWPVIGADAGGPGSSVGLDLIVYTQTGEALESGVVNFLAANQRLDVPLYDTFGLLRGTASLLAANTGCSILYARIVVDGEQIVPRAPAYYEQFKRYVEALGAADVCI